MSDKNNLPQPIFSEDQQAIWNTLASSNKSAAELIPDDLTPANVWAYLQVVTIGLKKAQQAVSRLKPYFGRILSLVQKHEHLYSQIGYDSFNDFMTRGVPELFGISRAEAFNCLRIAEVLDTLPSGTMESVGFSKLNLVASAVRKQTDSGTPIEMRKEKLEFWVAAAQSSTVKDLREQVEDATQTPPGDLGPQEPVTIFVTPEVKKRWKEFIADPSIQWYCNTEVPGFIFERLMDECSTEWTATFADAVRAQS
jgi:hypothetical protein